VLSSRFHAGLRLGGRMQAGNVAAERADGSQLFESPLFGVSATAGLGMHF
jgi:hypothetical protein